MHIQPKTGFLIFGSVLFLSACSADYIAPHIEDWDRNRITEVTNVIPTVSVCFDMDLHNREQIMAMATQECANRIHEIQNIVLTTSLRQNISQAQKAEGKGFQGPVAREKQIAAMIATLNLGYVENDVWECPLMTPNRITYKCDYDVNARDSVQRQQSDTAPAVSPDMPPELPQDLKPQ